MRVKYLFSITSIVLLLLAVIAWHQHSLHQSSSRVAKKNSVLPYLQAMKARQGIPAMRKSSSPLRAIPLEPSPLDHPSEEELRFFPGATVVASAEVTGPNPGQTTRLRILKVHGKYPMLRTEEVIDDASNNLVTRSEMAADHLLVTLTEGEDPEAVLKKMGQQAIAITRVTSGAPLYRVDLASASLEGLPQGLGQSTLATKGIGEPDFLVKQSMTPNNIYYNKQWSFWDEHLIGDSSINYQGISAEEAWNIRADASSVIVGVIDTGIRYTHQSLSRNMWHNPNPSTAGDVYGWNAYDNNGDPMSVPDETDGSGHGTHCAGTIGALGNASFGTCGVAWHVQLMACKYWGPGGGFNSDVITCIDYAINHGAQILNCSFGGYDWSFSEYDAFQRAQQRGVIAVCAAGNEGKNLDDTPFYPACFQLDNIVSVAAESPEDALSDYSNYGLITTQLAAPGDEIYSTWNDSDSSYDYMDGTSCAAPFVTGALALLKAQFPQDPYQSLIARLLRSVDKRPDFDKKTITGGTLNIANALLCPTPSPRSYYHPSESWPTFFNSWRE